MLGDYQCWLFLSGLIAIMLLTLLWPVPADVASDSAWTEQGIAMNRCSYWIGWGKPLLLEEGKSLAVRAVPFISTDVTAVAVVQLIEFSVNPLIFQLNSNWETACFLCGN